MLEGFDIMGEGDMFWGIGCIKVVEVFESIVGLCC